MSPRRIVVATHGHCFDGMASAAVFTHLLSELRGNRSLRFRFLSCGYGPNMSQVPAGWLDGDENAILDFRYTATEKLSWYFDHHITAFGSEEERDKALAEHDGSPTAKKRVYYDAAYGSCTKLIADTAEREHQVDMSKLKELVRWADIIDTAGFESAQDAIRRDEPVRQLAAVVEQHGDRAFLETIVPMLVDRSLEEVAQHPRIKEQWAPIAVAQAALTERIRSRSRVVGRVVITDLSDALLDTPAKFISYALFPECAYSITLSRSKQHYKLAVGYNPWCGVPRMHDIASLCRRLGGGGHAVVGAATFRLSEAAVARAASEQVLAELSA